MNTLDFLKRHVHDVQKVGYGQFQARVTLYGHSVHVRFTDSEVYDRIHFDRDSIADHVKGTGGYTLRQALDYIYHLSTERRKG